MISSRYSLIVSLFVLSFSVTGQSPTPTFSLRLSVTPDVVKEGFKGVSLRIYISNNTPQPVPFPTDRYHPEAGFTITLTDPTRQPAGKTRHYREVTGDKTGKNAVEPASDQSHVEIIIGSLNGAGRIAPGETLEQQVTLDSKLFDLSLSGTYSVQVERMDAVTKTLVKSNVVTFTVTN